MLQDAAFLSAVLDTLIPPARTGKPMPGAGGIGIETAIAELVATDTQAGAAVISALEALREGSPGFTGLAAVERTLALESQAALDPGALRALLRHVYLAYYQHPAVLVALGEPPRPPFPEGFDLEPTDPELLAALERRRS